MFDFIGQQDRMLKKHEPIMWRGCVEDNDDPLFRGRIKVRWMGLYTEINEIQERVGVPTANLPWVERAGSSFGSSMSSMGIFGLPPEKGSWVYGMFLDGGDDHEYRNAIYFGTITGIPLYKANKDYGYSDPTEEFPREDRLDPIGDVPFYIDWVRRIAHPPYQGELQILEQLFATSESVSLPIVTVTGGGVVESNLNLSQENITNILINSAQNVQNDLQDSATESFKNKANDSVSAAIKVLIQGDIGLGEEATPSTFIDTAIGNVLDKVNDELDGMLASVRDTMDSLTSECPLTDIKNFIEDQRQAAMNAIRNLSNNLQADGSTSLERCANRIIVGFEGEVNAVINDAISEVTGAIADAENQINQAISEPQSKLIAAIDETYTNMMNEFDAALTENFSDLEIMLLDCIVDLGQITSAVSDAVNTVVAIVDELMPDNICEAYAIGASLG